MTDLREILAAATPGPWRVGPVDDTVVVAADGSEIAAIDGDYNEPDLWPMMEANARLIALAPDLAAEVLALRDQVETAYVRGFHDAQEKAKVEGKLVLIDSPEIVSLRDENAKLREALRELVDRDAAYDGNRIIITADSHGDAIGRMSRARAALSDIKAITGGGE